MIMHILLILWQIRICALLLYAFVTFKMLTVAIQSFCVGKHQCKG